MDLPPRSLARALPWLAAALAAEGVVGLLIEYLGFGFYFDTCVQALVHVPEIVLLLVFAGAVRVMTAGGAARIPCQRLLYGGFASIAASSLARFVDVDIYADAPRGWLFAQAIGGVLTAVAAPGLWGSAIAREEDIGSARITAWARSSAGIAFGGFLSLLASQGFVVAALGTHLFQRLSPGLALSSLVLTAGRGFLLWGAWESWRPAADEVILRDRARRIRQGMLGFLLGSMGSSVITTFFWSIESHGFGESIYTNRPMLIWQGVVQLTLTLLTTILVAVALEAPERLHAPKRGPYFPALPPRPTDAGPIDVP